MEIIINIIKFILVLLIIAILFTSNKSKNFLFLFISILISFSLLIALLYEDALYISFLFILIYVSALSIMFGFIILLSPSFIEYNIPNRNLLIYILILGIMLFLYKYEINITPEISNSTIVTGEEFLRIELDNIYNYNILNKIAIIIYTLPSFILNFIISISILIIAMISLFYILF